MSPLERDLEEGQRWEFDEDVAAAFDDMLARSIPDYEQMRRLVTEVGGRFVRPDAAIVDLGTSRGEALAPFVFGSPKAHGNTFVGVEISEPMRASAIERFRDSSSRVTILSHDLRRGYPPVYKVTLTLCVLTLQFVPIEYRQRILREARERTIPGGALVLVEKVLGGSSRIDEKLVEIYLQRKRQSGYSDEEIERKRLALEGVLVPVTAAWNEDLLRGAGFSEVDCFWRWANFAGWVALP